MTKAATKTTIATDTAVETLFKTAPLGAGASDGGPEIEDGENAGESTGELPVEGEAAGV